MFACNSISLSAIFITLTIGLSYIIFVFIKYFFVILVLTFEILHGIFSNKFFIRIWFYSFIEFFIFRTESNCVVCLFSSVEHILSSLYIQIKAEETTFIHSMAVLRINITMPSDEWSTRTAYFGNSACFMLYLLTWNLQHQCAQSDVTWQIENCNRHWSDFYSKSQQYTAPTTSIRYFFFSCTLGNCDTDTGT